MATLTNTAAPRALWVKAMAMIGGAFGVLTVVSATTVLFGPARFGQAAGAFIPFVVWFNLWAGFAYIAAAIGIWRGRGWAFGLALVIAGATAAVAALFALSIAQGAAYEMRTVGALLFRVVLWAAVAVALYQQARRG